MSTEDARLYALLLTAAIALAERLTLHPTMPHGLPSPWLETTVVARNFKARTAHGIEKDRFNTWPETSENDPDKHFAVRRPILDKAGHLTDFAWTLHATLADANLAALCNDPVGSPS
jgi:hypothetical protein